MIMKLLAKLQILFFLLIFFNPLIASAADYNYLKGRFWQEKETGKIWYVHDTRLEKYPVNNIQDLNYLAKLLAVGITNKNLAKIKLGNFDAPGTDTDKEGLSDELETALGTNKYKADSDNDKNDDKKEIANGYNPIGPGKTIFDIGFAKKNLGRLFLQVENRGQLWYINPLDRKRYFLNSKSEALVVIKGLVSIASQSDLNNIQSGSGNERYDLYTMEKEIKALVDVERQKQGLATLKWNDELAAVAREHSQNLAKEDEELTNMKLTCDFPMIHHEGLNFGAYSQNRLNNRGIYYFSQSGENIALMPSAQRSISYDPLTEMAMAEKLQTCSNRQSQYNATLKSKTENNSYTEEQKINFIKEEITKRTNELKNEIAVKEVEFIWLGKNEVEEDTVNGWMNSPGHRANILKSDYDETGIGVAYVNGYIISTQVFIKKATCGFKNGACCEKEGYYPYCYSPYTCQTGLCQ